METVIISKAEYESLKRDSKILQALYAGGVDNWEWYGDSLDAINIDGDETYEEIYGE